jgi:hypothetical protein
VLRASGQTEIPPTDQTPCGAAVAREAHNLEAGGSTPPTATTSDEVQRLEVIAAGSLAAAIAAFRHANDLAVVAERDELNLRVARQKDLRERYAELEAAC